MWFDRDWDTVDFINSKVQEKVNSDQEFKNLERTYRELRGIKVGYYYNRDKDRLYNQEEIAEMKKFLKDNSARKEELEKAFQKNNLEEEELYKKYYIEFKGTQKEKKKLEKAYDEKIQFTNKLREELEPYSLAEGTLHKIEEFDNKLKELGEKSFDEFEKKILAREKNIVKQVLIENYDNPLIRRETMNAITLNSLGQISQFTERCYTGDHYLEVLRKIIVENLDSEKEREIIDSLKNRIEVGASTSTIEDKKASEKPVKEATSEEDSDASEME